MCYGYSLISFGVGLCHQQDTVAGLIVQVVVMKGTEHCCNMSVHMFLF